VDYDRSDLAAVYDRGRSHGSEVLDLWMDEVASHVRGRKVLKILDLGCETGRFSDALAK
jgi:2-polyprenyl-3-methyl-5-hydroxy-6-metoxy-1,4-benzoquinol methylase